MSMTGRGVYIRARYTYKGVPVCAVAEANAVEPAVEVEATVSCLTDRGHPAE